MRRLLSLALASSLLLLRGSAPFVLADSPAAAAPTASMESEASTLARPPEPTRAAMTLAAGTWYVGATPPNYDPAKPVLLFVHGKGGSASSWWGETTYHGVNDMYTHAYNNGYRTAFVDLHPEGTMWQNGQLLSGLLNRITAYFGVSKVTIVAHSKGGVDSNAASAHYSAAGKINRVITLGTPHHGTPLADLAYSTWTWWLAALLGQNTDATYVMQTGYMDYFRSVTDELDPAVSYATVSGYKCGPVFTALWMGCAAISGEDDGVVPVWSAQKPSAAHLRTGYWDHDEIRMGSRVWSTIQPRLTSTAAGGAVSADDSGLSQAAPGNLILRGGEVTGEVVEQSFPVERGVKSVSFLLFGSHEELSFSLVGPDGSRHPVNLDGQVPAGEILAGAWMGTVTVDRPKAGSWRLVADAPDRAAYLLVAALEGGVQAVLDRGTGASAPGAERALSLSLAGTARVKESRVLAGVARAGEKAASEAELLGAQGLHKAIIKAPDTAGVHNLTVTVTGTLTDGSAFERTLVSSFAVTEDGEIGER